MFALRNGEWAIRKGRLTCDMTVEAGASLRNDAEVFSHTFVSHGEIKGRGTIPERREPFFDLPGTFYVALRFYPRDDGETEKLTFEVVVT